jgi:hypothetical protein
MRVPEKNPAITAGLENGNRINRNFSACTKRRFPVRLDLPNCPRYALENLEGEPLMKKFLKDRRDRFSQ